MRIHRIIVSIPARNEGTLLAGCLSGVQLAVDALHQVRADFPVAVVVALDGCTDDSSAVAAQAGVHTVTLHGEGVGAARDAAIAHGLSLLSPASDTLSEHHTWVACTDADSVVPVTWLIHQLMWAESGMDLVIGTVEPYGPIEPSVLAVWHAQHRLAEGHPYVHGANLGMRADTWRAAGGFGPRTVDEDVELIARAQANTDRWVATDTTRVATSARLHGRIDGGFADYLNVLSEST